jgi:hypothetical protein
LNVRGADPSHIRDDHWSSRSLLSDRKSATAAGGRPAIDAEGFLSKNGLTSGGFCSVSAAARLAMNPADQGQQAVIPGLWPGMDEHWQAKFVAVSEE